MKSIVLFAFGILAATGVGCSDEGACDRIVEACHDKDPGSGPIHDCHEFAEDSTDEQCADREDDCLDECGG